MVWFDNNNKKKEKKPDFSDLGDCIAHTKKDCSCGC